MISSKQVIVMMWESTPKWIRYILVMLGTPVFLWSSFMSWHSSSIHAHIRPYEEKRDAEFRSRTIVIDERLNSINMSLKRIEDSNKIIINHLINK